MFKDRFNVIHVPTPSIGLVKDLVLKTQRRWNNESVLNMSQQNVSLRNQMKKLGWSCAKTPTFIRTDSEILYDVEEKEVVVNNLFEKIAYDFQFKNSKLCIDREAIEKQLTKIEPLTHQMYEFKSLELMEEAFLERFTSIRSFVEFEMSSICRQIKKIQVHLRGPGVLNTYSSLDAECGIFFNISGDVIIRSFPLPWLNVKNEQLKEKSDLGPTKMRNFLNNEGAGRAESTSKAIHLYKGESSFFMPTGCYQFEQRSAGVQVLIQFDVLSDDEKDPERFDYNDRSVKRKKEVKKNKKIKRESGVEFRGTKRMYETDEEYNDADDSESSNATNKNALFKAFKKMEKNVNKKLQEFTDKFDVFSREMSNKSKECTFKMDTPFQDPTHLEDDVLQSVDTKAAEKFISNGEDFQSPQSKKEYEIIQQIRLKGNEVLNVVNKSELELD